MIDSSTFRAVLGRLASGVSIVTTVGADGRDHGMTVSAFCSLSLDPPLVLLCVDKTATMHAPLLAASHFAVNLLALEQEALSRRFAESIDAKFDGVTVTRQLSGCALIDGALAHLECAMWAQHEGGDHTIFVGRVNRADAREAEPLLHYRGGYPRLANEPGHAMLTPARRSTPEFLDDPSTDLSTIAISGNEIAQCNRLFGGKAALLSELKPLWPSLRPRRRCSTSAAAWGSPAAARERGPARRHADGGRARPPGDPRRPRARTGRRIDRRRRIRDSHGRRQRGCRDGVSVPAPFLTTTRSRRWCAR